MTLSLMAIVFTLCSFSNCMGPSVEGKWKAKSADVKKMFADDETNISGASFEMTIDANTLTQKIKYTLIPEIGDDSDMEVEIPIEATIKYSYTREGELLKLNYLNCNAKFGEFELNATAREACEANGVDMTALKEAMNKDKAEGEREMKKSMEKDAEEETSMLIKKIEKNTLVLEDEDGEAEFIRVN